jgi:catechol 2,3-dioxygenase
VKDEVVMSTEGDLRSDPAEAPVTGPERITFGLVHLDIQDLNRSVRFWQDLLGLRPIETTEDAATLGIDNDPLLVLHRSASRPVQRGHSGLFHVAINLPSEPELARVLARMRASGHRFGTTDHIIAKSIYVSDPDGIGLEITFETPDRVRSYSWEKGNEHPLVIDSEGRRRGGVERLDEEELLAKLPAGGFMRPLPSGTHVGHFHLQVADLEASYRFYRDVIGLSPNMFAPWAGYGDLGAGGRVAHRIALNTWQGAGVPPRPSGVAGMRSYNIHFHSVELFRKAVATIGNAEAHDGAYLVRDPDGTTIVLRSST